jgi:GDPmannose 4,6-dehydratase
MGLLKNAVITGITGQDGALLARLLLQKGYMVHGIQRYAANDHTARLRSLLGHPRFHMHYGDMTDGGSLFALLHRLQPDEVYNLAAMSHVKVSFDLPEYAANVDGLGTLRLLEAIRTLNLAGKTRFYQASSSEMFGNAPAPQNEDTPFQPCSPYAAAKLYAYWLVRTYRQAYGLHASNGILFNHESALRGEAFVTRKITRAVAAIETGMQDRLTVGNLEARRDWGHARDYVEGMWMMLQQPRAGDYVLASGQSHSVRDFVMAAFAAVGVGIVWRGAGLNEKGYDARTGRLLVQVDQSLFRPAEVNHLLGDASKALRAFGWRAKTPFETLVRDMVMADRAALGLPPALDHANDDDHEFFMEAAE